MKNDFQYALLFGISSYNYIVAINSYLIWIIYSNIIFIHSSLWTLLQMWLEEFSEDFRDPPMHSSLRLMSLQLRRYTALFPLAKRYEALLKKFQAEGYYILLSYRFKKDFKKLN